jgi:hypothetical protein
VVFVHAETWLWQRVCECESDSLCVRVHGGSVPVGDNGDNVPVTTKASLSDYSDKTVRRLSVCDCNPAFGLSAVLRTREAHVIRRCRCAITRPLSGIRQ